MRVEHHGKRLAAPLSMPEHAALPVRSGRLLGSFYCLAYGEILVITGKDLDRVVVVARKADKVTQYIQKPLFVEHALVEGVELRISVVFVSAVLALPLHETVKPRGYGARPGRGQVAYHDKGVIDKQRGYVMKIIAYLIVCVLRADLVLGR